jgi:predicted glycosyltransferase
MLDIALLATTVVAKFLLPFVQDGVKAVRDAVTQKVSNQAADEVTKVQQELFDKVNHVFTDGDEQKALDLFKKKPDKAAALVEEYLRDRLQKDPHLAQEVDKLVNSKGPSGQTGAQIMNATIAAIIDNRNAKVSHSVQIGNVVGAASVGAVLGHIPSAPSPIPGGSKHGGGPRKPTGGET